MATNNEEGEEHDETYGSWWVLDNPVGSPCVTAVAFWERGLQTENAVEAGQVEWYFRLEGRALS